MVILTLVGGALAGNPLLAQTSMDFATISKFAMNNNLTIIFGCTPESYGNGTINFDKPFATECVAVVHAQVNAGHNDYDKTTITGWSKTGFSIASSSYKMRYMYIALGR